MKGPARKPLADRFWPRVDKSGDCWIWTGAKGHFGYGSVAKGGHQGGMVHAHRAAWQLTHGTIPDGLSVLHRCDRPACVNPEHLFLGTQADNIHDCIRKGRAGRRPESTGEHNGNARLSAGDIARIRRLAETEMTADLASEYGVSTNHIRRIVRGLAWPVREIR